MAGRLTGGGATRPGRAAARSGAGGTRVSAYGRNSVPSAEYCDFVAIGKYGKQLMTDTVLVLKAQETIGLVRMAEAILLMEEA